MFKIDIHLDFLSTVEMNKDKNSGVNHNCGANRAHQDDGFTKTEIKSNNIIKRAL